MRHHGKTRADFRKSPALETDIMARIVYVNGSYLPWGKAQVHAEDRGFQFGDAVYEVCEVRGGRLIDEVI